MRVPSPHSKEPATPLFALLPAIAFGMGTVALLFLLMQPLAPLACAS